VNIRKLLLALGGATSLTLMLAVPGTAALASTQSHPDFAAAASSSPVPAPYPGAVPAPNPGASAVLPAPPSAPVTSSPTAAAACTPYVDGDYAHVTSGDVSAHGWWYRNNCPNTKTTVTIGLQEYYSDGSWRTKATGSAYVYPGGGSANWANARHICESVVVAGWRSYVIVTIGNGASANTAAQNLACRTLT
jgi:hypothetical protein